MTDTVDVQDRDGVRVLCLNRPATKNALNQELVLELGARLQELPDATDVRAVVLTGAGGAFCSGADLKSAGFERAASGVAERLEEFHALVRGVTGAPQPVIAAMEGPAVGFGADLALSCDLRIMGAEAYVQEKFVKIGLMSDGGGSYWLPRMVGLARTMECLLFGESMSAEQCLQLGVVNRVVKKGAARQLAEEWAAQLAKGAPLALRAIKQSVRLSYQGGLEDALAREKEGQSKLLASADLREGVLAWMEQRPPQFTGK